MNIDEFSESVKYATRVIKLLKNDIAINMETSYIAFIHIVCAHALEISNVEVSTDNILRLLEKVHDTISEEIKQMIKERN
jgi:hypothetical protein